MSIAARPPIERFHENWVENENGCKIWSDIIRASSWKGTKV